MALALVSQTTGRLRNPSHSRANYAWPLAGRSNQWWKNDSTTTHGALSPRVNKMNYADLRGHQSNARGFSFISRNHSESICTSSRQRKSSVFAACRPMRGIFIVTTPTEPVSGLAPNNPPPRRANLPSIKRSRQHIDRASSGDSSLFTKFAKYKMPYLPWPTEVDDADEKNQNLW